MTNLLSLPFDDHTIRVVELDGRPWFVGRDVAAALGFADTVNALKQHCRGVVKRHPLTTAGGTQEVSIVGEADVLRLVVRSRLPGAERFERWVFEEVLPQIARTGRYGQPDAMAALSDPATLRELLLGYAERVVGLEQTVAAQAPKVEALDRIADARGALCLTDAAKALQMRPSDLIDWMQAHGWIHKRVGTAWRPYQQRIDKGQMVLKVVTRGEGAETRIFDQAKVTPKGLARLAELLAGPAPALPAARIA